MDVNIKLKGKIISRAKYCESFFSKTKGLMFSKKLQKGKSIILVDKFEPRFGSVIGMFFVFFSIDIIFLDSNKKVVDVRSAKPFQSYIAPKGSARYAIEMNKGENILKVGDKVSF